MSIDPTPLGTPKVSAGLSIAHGHINKIAGRSVSGWLYSPTRDVTPVLFVDGRPATLVEWPRPRADVAKKLGIAEDTGFRFQIDAARTGAKVELYALSRQHLHPVCHEYVKTPVSDANVFRQLDQIGRASCRERVF